MTTLFHAELSDRDFASHLLHVGDLLEWIKSKRLHLKTTPPVNDFEFVQVEALLCAIERNANNLTTDQALEIVLNTPALKDYPIFQKYPNDIDPTTCRWLIGANAHKKWRELLTGAIAAHELTLLDFGSKLPIHTAPAQTTTSAPVVAVGASTTPDPERRLARLRELGGNATYKRGEWKITGILALVASEKSENRKRSDEKTIRADLKEAAENEREAKRANAFSGLGQR